MISGPVLLSSAQVTDWPARAALTAGVLALILAVLALMRWGWVRRGRRQADIDSLPPVPELPATLLSGGEARYLGATRAGDWLDRVVVHGLGVPSAAEVAVARQGVWVLRTGAPDIFVAATDVVDVRHDRGIAGRVLESDGVLVLTWQHGNALIDLGFRVRNAGTAESLRTTIAKLSRSGPSTTAPLLSTIPPGDSA